MGTPPRGSCLRTRTGWQPPADPLATELSLRLEQPLANGRFQLGGLLGSGGMGAVYEAYDAHLGIVVALKVLRDVAPANVAHFRREFCALAGVEHPNLVQLGEFFNDGGRWFYTMELVAGDPFDVWVFQEPALRQARIRAGLVQLSAALDALHRLGKVHCDVKPQNVIVTRAGRVVLIDYGLVSDCHPREPAPEHSPREICGTPEYMAPEQATGACPSSAIDAYALGVMLYEALTGFLPFEGSVQTVLLAKQSEQAMPPSALAIDVPEDLEQLCLELLSIEAARRPNCTQIASRVAGKGRVFGHDAQA